MFQNRSYFMPLFNGHFDKKKFKYIRNYLETMEYVIFIYIYIYDGIIYRGKLKQKAMEWHWILPGN